MNSTAENNFIETLEYRRFAEFCDACRHCEYIGLCYGSPGVGKTLSARRYSLWDRIQGVKLRDLPEGELQELARVDALLYTTPVVNTPREIERDIPKLRDLLRDFRQEPIRREETRRLKQIQKRDADHRDSFFSDYDWFSEKLPTLKPTFGQVCRKYSDKQRAIGDPTRLILLDEADRLKMGSLEQMRSIFDAGGIGLVASPTFATGGGFRLFSTAYDPRRLINTGAWFQKCV
jgi:Cdc6-like AAA superfamily ATPase